MKIIVMNTDNFSVDILDVNDDMVKNGDVEGFLREQGFPMESISWTTRTFSVPVRYHFHKLVGSKKHHTVRKMKLVNLEPCVVACNLKKMEVGELTEAVKQHSNCEIDGNPAYRFDVDTDDLPMVPGYGYDGEPCDLVITAVSYDAEYHSVRIYGVDKEACQEERIIETVDIFAGTIHYITERIY